MIDPLKLMIGDWVWSLHYNNYYQITPESYFMCNSSGIITPRRIEGLDLEPISLTEDILNKYGMYNSGDNYYFTGSIRYRILHYKEIENTLNNIKQIVMKAVQNI